MNAADLKTILDAHREWLVSGREQGERADLSSADLRSAKTDESTQWPAFWHCPEVGAFTAWKKLHNGIIAELLIPAEAKRTSSLIGRKCRAEFAVVVSLTDRDGNAVTEGVSLHDRAFKYVVGATVRPDAYNDDFTVECAPAMHFYITRKEAEDHR